MAKAFANTLDPDYIRRVQRIKQKDFYIPTIDVVQKLQKEGWMINGVDEQRNKKSRKITNNYVQMTHPDFAVKNKQGKDEAYSSITIKNSCSGDQPLSMGLGAFRMVCSNGAIRFDEHAESENIKHIEINYRDLDRFVHSMNGKAQNLIELKEKRYPRMKEEVIYPEKNQITRKINAVDAPVMAAIVALIVTDVAAAAAAVVTKEPV